LDWLEKITTKAFSKKSGAVGSSEGTTLIQTDSQPLCQVRGHFFVAGQKVIILQKKQKILQNNINSPELRK